VSQTSVRERWRKERENFGGASYKDLAVERARMSLLCQALTEEKSVRKMGHLLLVQSKKEKSRTAVTGGPEVGEFKKKHWAISFI